MPVECADCKRLVAYVDMGRVVLVAALVVKTDEIVCKHCGAKLPGLLEEVL